MADSRDITGKNRRFTGTNSIRLPNGTTAQRIGSEAGEIRFNTSLNLAEYYDGTTWKAIDAPPVITGFTVDDVGGSPVTSANIDSSDATNSGNATIEVLGSLFDTTGAVVTFVGTGETLSTASITRDSANKLTVTVARSGFDNTNEPYTIKVLNGSGLSAELTGAINQDQPHTFDTASGNIGTVNTGDVDPTLSAVTATDPDSDTITYSITAGALPSGLSINSSTGAITGTAGTLTPGDTTFTVSAATSNLTITRQFTITMTNNLFVTATGGTVTTSGDYKIHTFTSPGTFEVTQTGAGDGPSVVDYLVVAGGGGGGCGDGIHGGGGGGAGGFRFSKSSFDASPSPASPRGAPAGITVSAQSYPITVGGGGAGGVFGGTVVRASNSVFSTITSTGGGGGALENSSPGPNLALPGGSGGGSGVDSGPPSTRPAGTGNTPPVSPSQGQPGGISLSNGNAGAGGGGGALVTGSNAPPPGTQGGPGGDGGGLPNAFGTSGQSSGGFYYFAGGGGGGSHGANVPAQATGGLGGGGAANPSGGVAGTANTGGGGGSVPTSNPGSAGGSGIVVIRYKFQ